jgi:hypothetical protein
MIDPIPPWGVFSINEFLTTSQNALAAGYRLFPGQFFIQKQTVDYPLLVRTLFKITHPQDIVSGYYSENSRLLIIVRTISERDAWNDRRFHAR